MTNLFFVGGARSQLSALVRSTKLEVDDNAGIVGAVLATGRAIPPECLSKRQAKLVLRRLGVAAHPEVIWPACEEKFGGENCQVQSGLFPHGRVPNPYENREKTLQLERWKKRFKAKPLAGKIARHPERMGWSGCRGKIPGWKPPCAERIRLDDW